MEFEFTEKELIYLLNSLNITIRFLKYHTLEEKKLLSSYFNFENYDDDYYLINLLHRRLSLKGNKQFYNIDNEIFFIGQRNFLTSSDKTVKAKISNNKNIFNRIVDKFKKVV